ncbi:MAG: winged helix-turn-helix domain-containing protein [Candidatus Acidiferrales bacterium]
MTQDRNLPLLQFGDFTVNSRARTLHKHGVRLKLHGQPFEILLLLLSRPGDVVTREELQAKLWSGNTFVDFEHGLNTAIKKLRQTLGDSACEPRFIETVPRIGYRFIAPVDASSEEKIPVVPAQEPAREPVRLSRKRVAVFALAGFAVLLVGLIAYRSLVPLPPPRVLRILQLTHSGHADPWAQLVTDGVRIYFLEREGSHWNLMQTSVEGGTAQSVPAPFTNTRIMGISPGQTELLLATFTVREEKMPLWIQAIPGGAPHRLGNISAYDAEWLPNGKIVYSNGPDFFEVGIDGRNPRKLLSGSGSVGWLATSPDGHTLRFSRRNPSTLAQKIWAAASNGANAHPLIVRGEDLSGCCGSWTPDGRYFVYSAGSGPTGNSDIWIIQEKGSWFHRRQRRPIRLTNGPLQFGWPVPDKTGKRVFVYGSDLKEEFVRYDAKTKHFDPMLHDLQPIDAVSSSPDGQWIAYASSRDYAIWRSRTDGSEPLELTPSGIRALRPRWSPDGKQVVFAGGHLGELTRIYVAPSEGEATEPLPLGYGAENPDWSPDGRSLVFDTTTSAGETGTVVNVFDFATGNVLKLTGSEGLFLPRWSPDGRSIAALTLKQRRLMLYSVSSRHWKELAHGTLLSTFVWSKDGKYVYAQDLAETGQPVYRIDVSTGIRKKTVSCEALFRGNVQRCGFSGLAPDGSPLFVLSESSADIYAIDLELP